MSTMSDLDIDRQEVRREVGEIVAAWPLATVDWQTNELEAMVVIREPESTTLVEVTATGTRSMRIPHTPADFGPFWREGWDD